MSKSYKSFINYLMEQVANHSIYVRGAQGQNDITDDFISKREYGDKTQIKRDKALRDQYYKLGYKNVMRAFDCSGLGMYWLQNVTGICASDMTANGMKGKCKQISLSEVKAGDWVFVVKNGKADHIGYMITDTLLVEARGRDYGVIISTLDNRFNYYGRPSYFNDEIENNDEEIKLDMEQIYNISKRYSEV